MSAMKSVVMCLLRVKLELSKESRVITCATYSTHTGLYRYKRLMFGATSAPEICQHAIQEALH